MESPYLWIQITLTWTKGFTGLWKLQLTRLESWERTLQMRPQHKINFFIQRKSIKRTILLYTIKTRGERILQIKIRLLLLGSDTAQRKEQKSSKLSIKSSHSTKSHISGLNMETLTLMSSQPLTKIGDLTIWATNFNTVMTSKEGSKWQKRQLILKKFTVVL